MALNYSAPSPELAAELAEVLADYSYDKWHKLKERILKLADMVREIADDIANFAKKLERSRRVTETEDQEFDLDEATRMI